MNEPAANQTNPELLLLRAVFNLMPDAIIVMDDAGRITLKNNGALRLLPELKDLAPSEDIIHHVPCLSRYEKPFRDAIENRCPAELAPEPWKDKILRAAIFPIEGARGAVLMISDVTDSQKFEASRIQALKTEAVESLIGGLTHDFNNILSGMMMTVDYMQQYVMAEDADFDREDIREEMGILSASLRRASGLMQQLLLVSSRADALIASVDLVALVERVLEVCRKSFDKRIEIDVKLPGKPVTLRADAAQLETAVFNLCLNASQAMTVMRSSDEEWGGTLSVRLNTALLAGPRGSGPGDAAHNFGCLAIGDTGVGMNESVLKKIFDPFFSTKETGKGPGLGLAIVNSIVRRCGGRIEVSSTVGRGSLFQVYFPMKGQDSPATGTLENRL